MNFFSHKVLFCAFALFILYSCNTNKKNELMVFDKEKPNSFTLANKQGGAPFIIDAAEDDVVGIAVDMTATDILTITGNKPEVSSSLSKQIPHVVIVGTIGRSSFINQLIDEGKIDVSQIKDQWEAHQLEIIDKPFDGVEKALVITGSDRRGTAYGLVELSRMMGVSPWVWWADVVPEKQKALYLTGPKKVVKTPSVQYRGIFLNDEDWALQPWAAKNIDTDIEDIGSKTYAKIFELMIRLKANTIWPAMHPCTKAFYFYPENKVVADKYAIVVGASHCEPLNRNNVFEWNMNFENEYGEATGDWRYDTNKRQIHRYWNDRVAESHQYENFYTIGMRGIHDSGMPGPREQDKKIELLEKVINDQREIFSSHFAGNEQVPQLFCPYKEVLTLYQSGLELPDDITLVWDDDNHGYIRKLSTPEEQERSGGSGVYYHISYWGKPHDYLWLTTTSPSLMAYQMHKAYQFNARKFWMLNVGDIKPAEMETEFFMDMAWNIEKWTPQNAHTYSEYWASQTFGDDAAGQIAEIKEEYYRLAQNGKPEHMRMLHFSPETREERLADYQKLIQEVASLEKSIPERLSDAYFQLIKYPVYGSALMNQKVLYAETSLDMAEKGKTEALDMAAKAEEAFNQIKELTRVYNEDIADGKWNGMMSYNPRGLPVYGMPPVATAEMINGTEPVERIDVSQHKYLSDIGGTSNRNNIDSKNQIIAHNFTKKHSVEGEEIVTIEGLGLCGQTISRYPFTGKSYTDSEVTAAPYVEYTTKTDPGTYEISVKCLPEHHIHKGRSVRYAISVNNSAPEVVNVDVDRSLRYWIPAVLRGYSEGITSHELKENNVIRIYLMDTNTAVSRVDIAQH
jgi:hypothetical protein